MMRFACLLLAGLATMFADVALAQSALDIPLIKLQSQPGGGQTLSLSLQTLALMTALTLLPSLLLVTTSFTRMPINSLATSSTDLPGYNQFKSSSDNFTTEERDTHLKTCFKYRGLSAITDGLIFGS